jgi:hypothetical protein
MEKQLLPFLSWVAAPIALGITNINPLSGHPNREFGRSLNQPVMLPYPIAIAAPAKPSEKQFTPTPAYKRTMIQGFTVLINPAVLKQLQSARDLQMELDRQLAAIARMVPARPLAALKQVRIWVEWAKRPQGAAEFHPSAQWLRQNGYNPEKAGAVEIANVQNFVQWSRSTQPWMILHELAHTYHHRVLGEQNAAIEATYHQAIQRNLYQSVNYIQGGKQKAYALTDAKEYFAELSEAYFGKNDFYPFTRSELKTYDPVGYQLMEKVWGKPRK